MTSQIKEYDYELNHSFLTSILKNHQFEHNLKLYNNTEVFSYVATINQQYVGGYIAKRTDDLVHLELLAVDIRLRKQNIGSQLMDHLIAIAKKEGCTRLTVTTLDFQAKNFYIKKGFNIFGTLTNTPIKDVTKFYLTLIL